MLQLAKSWPDGLAGSWPPRRVHVTYNTARQLRPTEVDELVAGYGAGATVFELGARFDIDRRTVGQHLRSRGVDTTPPGLHPDDVPTAIRLYQDGWSLARLSNKFGTTDMTVRARLLEAGVVMRPAWRPKGS